MARCTPRSSWKWLPCLGLLLHWGAETRAQAATLTVKPELSLAWWQMDPHYNHLWATTCPKDPSWQPGEGRDEGWEVDYSARPTIRDAGRSDPRIPLFPRRRARPLCSLAVVGQITVDDTVTWKQARGQVVVRLDSLVTGHRIRDEYARRLVLTTGEYPTVSFTLDSLSNVQVGDTIRATAVGALELRGVKTALRVPVKGWREAGGLRVLAQFSLPAEDLTETYGMSKWALGLGVVLKRWKTLHLGVDLVLESPK